MYRIDLENFSFYAIIGILDKERQTPQKIEVRASFWYEEGFVDYAKLTTLIQHTLQKEEFFLIEDALQTLAKKIKEQFLPIKKMEITIKKPHILPNCTPSVTLTL